MKPLADGSHAVAILNPSDAAQRVSLNFATVGLNGKYTVRDVWQHRNIAQRANKWKGTVAAHETKVFVLLLQVFLLFSLFKVEAVVT